MKTLLCVGGPLDGETRQIHDGMPSVRVPWMTYLPDKAEFTELVYARVRFFNTEFLYYATDDPITAAYKLLACYAPRLAKLAQDEQRRIDRQIPPSSLQT